MRNMVIREALLLVQQEEGIAEEPQREADLRHVQHAAESGDPAAMCDLSDLLMKQRRSSEALYWLEQSARNGDPRGQYVLGTWYLKRGNVQNALRWLTAAADLGSSTRPVSSGRAVPEGRTGGEEFGAGSPISDCFCGVRKPVCSVHTGKSVSFRKWGLQRRGPGTGVAIPFCARETPYCPTSAGSPGPELDNCGPVCDPAPVPHEPDLRRQLQDRRYAPGATNRPQAPPTVPGAETRSGAQAG